LNAANTTPHPKPVIVDNIMFFILFFILSNFWQKSQKFFRVFI
jgi:hypothetical protein